MAHNGSREYWADYTKAFAIWLMVLCHFGLRPNGLVQFIGIFHMPVFFLISGYFDKGKTFSYDLIRKDFKKLMIPYFFFNICSFSICWISPYLHPEIYHNGTLSQTFLKAFIGMFLMEDQVRPYAFMPTGALWFLVALFNIKIIFAMLCKYWKINKFYILTICFVGLFTVYYRFPFFSLDSAFIALPFYIVGYIVKKYSVIQYPNKRWKMLVLSIFCWIYLILIGVHNGHISIDGCVMGNSVLFFYINGIIGSLACIYFFRFLNFENRYLQKIGASTLTILGTHGYINKIFTTVGVVLIGVAPREIPIWYILISSVIALIFGITVEDLLSKYAPSMIGKSVNSNKQIN